MSDQGRWAPQDIPPEQLDLSADQLADISSTIELVFQRPLPYVVAGGDRIPRMNGRSVDIKTEAGHLTIQTRSNPEGRSVLGHSLTEPAPPSPVPGDTFDVVTRSAWAFVERVFPWALGMEVSGPTENDHGYVVEYDMVWQQKLGRVIMPSSVGLSLERSGRVSHFCGWHEPGAPPPDIRLSEEDAIQAAWEVPNTWWAGGEPRPYRGLPPTQVRALMGRVEGSLRTYWEVSLPAGHGVQVQVDAATGEILGIGHNK
ncbi:MAG: hypothetical protein ACYC1D_17820 [Acidimicrobiales bacterium]